MTDRGDPKRSLSALVIADNDGDDLQIVDDDSSFDEAKLVEKVPDLNSDSSGTVKFINHILQTDTLYSPSIIKRFGPLLEQKISTAVEKNDELSKAFLSIASNILVNFSDGRINLVPSEVRVGLLNTCEKALEKAKQLAKDPTIILEIAFEMYKTCRLQLNQMYAEFRTLVSEQKTTEADSLARAIKSYEEFLQNKQKEVLGLLDNRSISLGSVPNLIRWASLHFRENRGSGGFLDCQEMLRIVRVREEETKDENKDENKDEKKKTTQPT